MATICLPFLQFMNHGYFIRFSFSVLFVEIQIK